MKRLFRHIKEIRIEIKIAKDNTFAIFLLCNKLLIKKVVTNRKKYDIILNNYGLKEILK